MKESSCCAVARKMDGKKCPICLQPIRLARVLRLLRYDANTWWYFKRLAESSYAPYQEEARTLKRASIRKQVQFIRESINRPIRTYRTSVIEFTDSMADQRRPFDLRPETPVARTVCVSGCHPGGFAAFVYCWAHRIGLTYTAKASDRV